MLSRTKVSWTALCPQSQHPEKKLSSRGGAHELRKRCTCWSPLQRTALSLNPFPALKSKYDQKERAMVEDYLTSEQFTIPHHSS